MVGELNDLGRTFLLHLKLTHTGTIHVIYWITIALRIYQDTIPLTLIENAMKGLEE